MAKRAKTYPARVRNAYYSSNEIGNRVLVTRQSRERPSSATEAVWYQNCAEFKL